MGSILRPWSETEQALDGVVEPQPTLNRHSPPMVALFSSLSLGRASLAWIASFNLYLLSIYRWAQNQLIPTILISFPQDRRCARKRFLILIHNVGTYVTLVLQKIGAGGKPGNELVPWWFSCVIIRSANRPPPSSNYFPTQEGLIVSQPWTTQFNNESIITLFLDPPVLLRSRYIGPFQGCGESGKYKNFDK